MCSAIRDTLDSRLPSSSNPAHCKSPPRKEQRVDGTGASPASLAPSKEHGVGKGGSPVHRAMPRRLALALALLFTAASAFCAGTMYRVLLSNRAGSHLLSAATSGRGGEGDGGKGGRDFPSGQVLLVDMQHIDADFLNSEDRLVQAMIDLVDESELSMLSYHCHSLVSGGVTCAAVLSEGHISFLTWPMDGAIVVDLLANGAEALVDTLPVVEKLFAIPGLGPEPSTVWSHKSRGFRPTGRSPLDQDLGIDYIQVHGHEMKVQLLSEETEFQHVAVMEYIKPQRSLASYERSLSGDGSYESLHPEMYRPDKLLFLDGVQQSSLYGDAAYHEALVHPAMLAHPNPKRVAIIGGGEGATLREVLKHNTVEEVYMIEIDEELVGLCREHLSEWSECFDNSGSNAGSCFDDTRAVVVFEDAFKFFLDNFGGQDEDHGEDDNENNDEDDGKEDKFDVIIMDALDPDRMAEIVGNLYKDGDFVDSLFEGLTEKGVLIIQIGETDTLDDPAAEMGRDIDRANMMEELEEAGFQSMHFYEEGHSHFSAPWSYLVSFKDIKSRASWYRTSAEVELELHQRLHRTNSGRPALSFFDGPTMMGYQFPLKAIETKYCRKLDKPWECGNVGFYPEKTSIHPAVFDAGNGGAGQHAGRGLPTLRDLPRKSTLDLAYTVKAFHVLPSTFEAIEDLYKWAEDDGECNHVKNELAGVKAFTEGYGHGNYVYGKIAYSIDSGIEIFCNHVCDGTYNYGDADADLEVAEMNVDIDGAPEGVMKEFSAVYSPVYERHLRQISARGLAALRDTKTGEEILWKYLLLRWHER